MIDYLQRFHEEALQRDVYWQYLCIFVFFIGVMLVRWGKANS